MTSRRQDGRLYQGVALILKLGADKALLGYNCIHSILILARFKTAVGKIIVIQGYTNICIHEGRARRILHIARHNKQDIKIGYYNNNGRLQCQSKKTLGNIEWPRKIWIWRNKMKEGQRLLHFYLNNNLRLLPVEMKEEMDMGSNRRRIEKHDRLHPCK